jgi:hypothetical protein
MAILSHEMITHRVLQGAATKPAPPKLYTSEPIDTFGFRGLRILVVLDKVTGGAVTNVTLQHGDLPDLSDAVDIADSLLALSASAAQVCSVYEVLAMTRRYLRVQIEGAAQNVDVRAVLVELHSPMTLPVEQPVLGDMLLLRSPVDGVAGTALAPGGPVSRSFTATSYQSKGDVDMATVPVKIEGTMTIEGLTAGLPLPPVDPTAPVDPGYGVPGVPPLEPPPPDAATKPLPTAPAYLILYVPGQGYRSVPLTPGMPVVTPPIAPAVPPTTPAPQPTK